MIVQGGTNKIERGGDNVVESNFKIKATGKAFKILSDGLYSDKPLAIVRELCCNAYDAHVAAGKQDVPFTVHLPSWAEPYFSVKDEGTGLTDFQVRGGWHNEKTDEWLTHEAGDDLYLEHKLKETAPADHPLFGFEKVGGIFTTYFESTKSNSNDFIGALGLGSKSPFSYVDSYTVISRVNGRKLSYNAFLNEDDCPSIALLFEEDTTEGNGIEITMPVRQQDFDTFRQKAEEVLKWFNPTPIITGNKNFNIKHDEYEFEGTGWKLKKGGDYWSRNRATAIQGKIAYPINREAVVNSLSPSEMAILENGFLIEFEIGELEVAASRESLSFKPATILNIKKRLKFIADELPSKFQASIDACESLWDARAKLRELVEQYQVLRSLSNHNVLKFEWKGQQLNNSYIGLKYNEYPGLTLTWYRGRSTDRYVFDDLTDSKAEFTTRPDVNIVFYVNDIKRGAAGRARYEHLQAPHSRSTYLISCEDQAVIDKFVSDLGDPSTKKVSELPKPPSKDGGVRKTAVQKLVKQQWSDRYAFQSLTDDDEFEIEDGGFYVPLFRGTPVKAGTEERVEAFSEIIDKAIKMKLISDKDVIYGATRESVKKFDNNDAWVNIIDAITEKFHAYLAKHKLADQAAMKQSLNEWNSNESWTAYWINFIKPYLPDNHIIAQFQDKRGEVNKLEVDQPIALAAFLGIKLEATGTGYDFTQEWKRIKDRYPLIDTRSRIDPDLAKPLATYFVLMDKELEKAKEFQ